VEDEESGRRSHSGAVGAVIGTGFCATKEALLRPEAKDLLLRAKSGDTVRTRIFDEVNGIEWPVALTSRVLKNRFFEEWGGKEVQLDNNELVRAEYRASAQKGDLQR
jgi:nitronate monooxygenase